MTDLDWLLDSDPAIRWQAMRDLSDAPAEEVAAERARVAKEGWGARLLALQGAGGQWAGGTLFPKQLGTTSSLMLLRDFGLDPRAKRRAVPSASSASTAAGITPASPSSRARSSRASTARRVTLGAYFDQEVQCIVDRLLTEQMADGGWNCEQENGSTRGSIEFVARCCKSTRRADRDPIVGIAQSALGSYAT